MMNILESLADFKKRIRKIPAKDVESQPIQLQPDNLQREAKLSSDSLSIYQESNLLGDSLRDCLKDTNLRHTHAHVTE